MSFGQAILSYLSDKYNGNFVVRYDATSNSFLVTVKAIQGIEFTDEYYLLPVNCLQRNFELEMKLISIHIEELWRNLLFK